MNAETEIVLANLDHLIYHHGMRLDYGSRAVLTLDGDVAYTLDDLAVPGLTPAGQRLAGRLPAAICYTDVSSSPEMVPKPFGDLRSLCGSTCPVAMAVRADTAALERIPALAALAPAPAEISAYAYAQCVVLGNAGRLARCIAGIAPWASRGAWHGFPPVVVRTAGSR